MKSTVIENLSKFFDDIEDELNGFVDRVELMPVEVDDDVYITGFRISRYSSDDIEVHLKHIKKIKLDKIEPPITDENGWFLLEPDDEMWVSCTIVSDIKLQKALDRFIDNYNSLTTIHVMETKWRDEGEPRSNLEVSLFDNKRAACKEALAMRKQHNNVTNKFEMYNHKGEILNSPIVKKEPTDFELVTCSIDKL